MKQYQDILRKVLQEGKKKPSRPGIDTLTLPNVFFNHDMADGFPLLTCRKMPIKSIAVELEFFIKGLTSKKWLQDRGCHFWDEWANPEKAFIEYKTREHNCNLPYQTLKEVQKEIIDLGPIGYSFQLRSFNKVYSEDDNGCIYTYDQLKDIVDKLHNNYNDRRMVASLWNVVQMDIQALPPCTVAWNVNVTDGKLNLAYLQRSQDLIRGFGADAASLGLLLLLLCKEGNFQPGLLSGLLVDCHIYDNQIEAAKEILNREPKTLPTIFIHDKPDGTFSIFDWKYTNFTIHNYDPHPPIQLGDIAV